MTTEEKLDILRQSIVEIFSQMESNLILESSQKDLDLEELRKSNWGKIRDLRKQLEAGFCLPEQL